MAKVNQTYKWFIHFLESGFLKPTIINKLKKTLDKEIREEK
jgi:hypothetical protein